MVLKMMSLAIVISGLFLAQSASAGEAERVAKARKSAGQKVAKRCKSAGLPYPPAELLLRAFKDEKVLEIWGNSESGAAMTKIASFPIAAASGVLGPKRTEGDRQVPEGIYQISGFNPWSNYHLSMRVNYPNASDRVRGSAAKLGGDIFIHGNKKSIGCLAMTDSVIDEIYLLCADVASSKGHVAVHIFPGRMSATWMDKNLPEHPKWETFWRELQPIYDAFERTRSLPKVKIDRRGAYRLIAPGS